MVGNEHIIQQYADEMKDAEESHWKFEWQPSGLEDDSTCNWCRLAHHRGPYLLRQIEKLEKDSYSECLHGACRCMVMLKDR